MKRFWLFTALIATLIILDQVSKWIIKDNFLVGQSLTVIPGLFSITYVRNPGAAFGFMAQAHESIRKPLFLLIPVIACIWLVWLIWASKNKNPFLCLAYSLIFAGAVGNLIDRFSLGYVVDFVDVYWKNSHFPAFNVADSCISIAAILLIIDFVLQLIKNKKAQKDVANNPV